MDRAIRYRDAGDRRYRMESQMARRSVSLGVDRDGKLIRVRVPAGSHRLALDYSADRWDLLGRAISRVTLLGLAALAAARIGSGRQPDASPPADLRRG